MKLFFSQFNYCHPTLDLNFHQPFPPSLFLLYKISPRLTPPIPTKTKYLQVYQINDPANTCRTADAFNDSSGGEIRETHPEKVTKKLDEFSVVER
jgi:hypothetical protein